MFGQYDRYGLKLNDILSEDKLPFNFENVFKLNKYFSGSAFRIKGKLIAVMFEDVTLKKENEVKIIESEEKFRSLFENSYDGIVILDFNFNIIHINNMALIILGTIKNNGDHIGFFEYFSIEDGLKLKGDFLKLKFDEFNRIDKITANSLMGQVIIEISAKKIELERSKGFLIIIRDITDKVQYEKKLLDAIVTGEERERKRISGDLHDEVGPLLASMRIYLSTIIQKENFKDQKEIILKIVDLLKNTTDTIRRISNNISPLLLENYGLGIAIRNELDLINDFFILEYTIGIESMKFEFNVELNIYRIIKELINNSLKHSNAKKIWLSIYYSSNILSVNFRDDGVGFEYDILNGRNQNGLGLLNIKNRVKIINGQFEIQSKTGSGFKFLLNIKTFAI